MEGPTPVSALIHAATMVTAGVYMVARTNALFVLSPTALAVVAAIGAATAFWAASIGLVQNDIKRVLAYSTISQLGYMFLACGVGAFGAGIFHLMTHAFFKALLFLGSGSVIHAMSGEQDMRKMGALCEQDSHHRQDVARGTLAIAALPPLAGFFSKDEILWQSFAEPLRPACCFGSSAAHRGHDGVLHVPAVLHDVFRIFPRAARSRAPRSRIARDDVASVVAPGAGFPSLAGWWAGRPAAGRLEPASRVPGAGFRESRPVARAASRLLTVSNLV